MSSEPVRKGYYAARFRFALPFFLILWLAVILFIVAVSLIVKKQMEDDQIRDVGRRLAGFLAVNPVSASSFDFSQQRGETGELKGLAFIRMVRNGEQILLAQSASEPVDFHRLAALDEKVSGVWISLVDPKMPGTWTIISETLAGGIRIQAGEESEDSVRLYDRIAAFCRWAVVLGGGLSLGLALACVKLSIAPMKKIHADIAAILADGRSNALLPAHRGRELVDLYGQFNQLLEQNRQLVTELEASLDNVAHDLRTPMTRLRAMAEYALQADADTKRLKEALSDCLEESERVLSMLKIMMSVAEAESGTMHLQKESVDLGVSLADVVTLYEYVAEEKTIKITTDLQDGIRVAADKTRMVQVWANLLDNSIKYGRQGGEVKISLESDGRDAVVVFADDGIGISKNEIHRIWDRLYRGDRSRTQPGLGLGLNYVKAVVEAHGGTIAVESELQRGTRFIVRLQHHQPEPQAGSVISRSQIKGE